jgi:hypothetical protein
MITEGFPIKPWGVHPIRCSTEPFFSGMRFPLPEEWRSAMQNAANSDRSRMLTPATLAKTMLQTGLK